MLLANLELLQDVQDVFLVPRVPMWGYISSLGNVSKCAAFVLPVCLFSDNKRF